MSTPQHPLPPKKEVALALLERSSVHLHLDPRVEGVAVPQWFKKQAQLVLQIGLNMPVPIPDLRLDDDGMSCTLSFNRSPFYCVVPWKSVFAMVGEDQRGMVWPDDVPAELTQKAAAATKPEPVKKEAARRDEIVPASSKPKRPRKKPQLAAVADRTDRDEAAPPKKMPVAVPAPVSSPAIEDAAKPAPAAAPIPDPSTSPRAPVSPQRKPKRELPPYLRVVK